MRPVTRALSVLILLSILSSFLPPAAAQAAPVHPPPVVGKYTG
jgi:hypothetical protein